MPTIDVRDPTDAQLIAASRFDGVHFLSVLDRHAAAVHRYLGDRLGADVAVAHVGEVFTVAYASRRHFRAWNESARPWFLGVATGVVRKQWRLEQCQLRRIGRGVAPFAEPVADHLQHLDARDRDVVLLAAWCDLEPAAVAMALDLPSGTVAARLDGLVRHVLAHAQAGAGPTAVPGPGVVAGGLDLIRALRPGGTAPAPDLVAAVRAELQRETGQPNAPGTRRSTSSVAAEHEQLRRWLASPGALVASLRGRGPVPPPSSAAGGPRTDPPTP